MANKFVFVSPGAKFKETDLTFVTKNVGVTTLGLVGETTKGPAFQPINVTSKADFSSRFGNQSVEKYPNGNLKYQLPYVANAYLEQSDQLVITRLLGLSGYQAGTAFGLKVSAGVDLSTAVAASGATTGTSSFSNSVYLGVTITNVNQTGIVSTGYTKISATAFKSIITNFKVITLVNGSGTVHFTATTYNAQSLSKYEGMVVAIVRSRATVADNVDASPTTTFEATQLQVVANATNVGAGDFFGKFTLRAGTGFTNTEDYVVSLNPDAKEFLPNVIGSAPKGKNTKIYVDEIYSDLIAKLDADGAVYGVSSSVISATNSNFTNFRFPFKTPETPWVVSELRGNKIDRLFKLISISDGESANSEIKISIQNIDPISQEFDIIVRSFFDTDDNVQVLESFSRCTMQKGLNNYVGRMIGDGDEFAYQSNYIYIQIDDNAPIDSFPAGFEGYVIYDWSSGSTASAVNGQSPEILYKTGYTASDKLNRVFLGISERAFDADNLVGTGIDQNFFNFDGLDISTTNGNAPSGYIKTKGFHMDSTATGSSYVDGLTQIGSFVVGAAPFQTAVDVTNPSNPYSNKAARKFTFVPYGGFDGWNEHRFTRSNSDLFKKGAIYDGVPAGATPSNDYQAWEEGIQTFASADNVTINLFATPGINFSDQLGLVGEAVDMIENGRGDSLYLIDAPDLPDNTGLAGDIVDILDSTDIDTNYAATFYPWIQVQDAQNNQNVYLPPTLDVVKAIAFTDNIAYPWFAPAGLNRGTTDALRARRKLSQGDKDTLYAGRINPMVTFTDTGVAIMGQKTLQKKQTALDRINVRRLLLQMRVLIANVANRLLFEQNDQTTIDQFLSKVNPILETIKRERGLTDFKVVMDSSLNTPETIDRNEMYGKIYIIPTKSVEFIGIEFVVTPTGTNFANI